MESNRLIPLVTYEIGGHAVSPAEVRYFAERLLEYMEPQADGSTEIQGIDGTKVAKVRESATEIEAMPLILVDWWEERSRRWL